MNQANSDPLTASCPPAKACPFFIITDKSKVPPLKREAIYLKVFGTVEQIRIEEMRQRRMKPHPRWVSAYTRKDGKRISGFYTKPRTSRRFGA